MLNFRLSSITFLLSLLLLAYSVSFSFLLLRTWYSLRDILTLNWYLTRIRNKFDRIVRRFDCEIVEDAKLSSMVDRDKRAFYRNEYRYR